MGWHSESPQVWRATGKVRSGMPHKSKQCEQQGAGLCSGAAPRPSGHGIPFLSLFWGCSQGFCTSPNFLSFPEAGQAGKQPCKRAQIEALMQPPESPHAGFHLCRNVALIPVSSKNSLSPFLFLSEIRHNNKMKQNVQCPFPCTVRPIIISTQSSRMQRCTHVSLDWDSSFLKSQVCSFSNTFP